MEQFRNLPLQPKALASMIETRPGATVSMALSRHPEVEMTLFAFGEGDGVSTEYYLGDTMYLVVEGKMPLTKEGESYLLEEGCCMMVPGRQHHAIGGAGPFKLLQMTFINEKEIL